MSSRGVKATLDTPAPEHLTQPQPHDADHANHGHASGSPAGKVGLG